MDVRGVAISVNEDPEQFRRKAEEVRRSALRGLQQDNVRPGAHTPFLEEAGNRFTVDVATDVIWTMARDLPNGWHCHVVQLGAGRVSFSAAAGAFVNAAGNARSRAQYSRVTVEVVRNANGQSAEYVVSGDIG